MRFWTRGFLFLAACCFLLILIAGANRLIGHEENCPDQGVEVREVLLAAPATLHHITGTASGNRNVSARMDTAVLSENAPVFTGIRTDANGTIIWGRRSYMHLRYQAFSLSDGFV